MFVDAHTHLDPGYYDDDPEAVVARAVDAAVDQLVVVGCGVEASRHAVALAERHPGRLFAAVGIHPHDAEKMTDADFEAIAELARRPETVAVGETGLDYYYDHSPHEVQQAAFVRFCRLAKEVGKPVVVHTRDAEADTVRLLEAEAPFPAGGQIHCFTGTTALSRPALALGFHVSVAGVVTFNSAGDLRAAVAEVPLDRLLVETDAPYLTPAPFRGRKNEAMFVPTVAATVAGLKGVSLAEAARATSENARRLFRLPEPPAAHWLAFAAGRVLHLNGAADPEAVREAAARVTLKKVRQVAVHGGGALPKWAKERDLEPVEA
jgi:TatD DNase family protein